MKLLLTNDDGIDAPGLEALEQAARSVGEVVVVAPAQALSGCGHQATTTGPIEVVERSPDHFAVHGTPVDCVRIGLLHLAEDVAWVWSGVNDGGNLGVDIFMSGTVAAVREAALLGKQAVAFSQYRTRQQPPDWRQAAQWVQQAWGKLASEGPIRRSYWNVNFPCVADERQHVDLVDCVPDDCPLPVAYQQQDNSFSYRGNYQQRERNHGSDVSVCFSGSISISRVSAKPD